MEDGSQATINDFWEINGEEVA